MDRVFEYNFLANGSQTVDTAFGEYGFLAAGNFGGGTLEVTFLGKTSAEAYDVFGTDTQLTADGQFSLKVPAGMKTVITLTGATSPDIWVALGVTGG